MESSIKCVFPAEKSQTMDHSIILEQDTFSEPQNFTTQTPGYLALIHEFTNMDNGLLETLLGNLA